MGRKDVEFPGRFGRAMPLFMPDSTIELPFSNTVDAALPAVQSEREIRAEVVSLHDEFRGRLLRYVVSLGVYAQDGEDIIQEVFLSLFRHLRLGKSRSNLRGWMFRVAHNLALKQRNSRSRRQGRVESERRIREIQIDPAMNPEEQLADGERQKRLLAIVHALPEQDQWCLTMRAEGLRYREIADVLGMSLGSVSNSLARSMARLARADER
jgi:RNA polymerase sigma-70 factor, ECF subfamily